MENSEPFRILTVCTGNICRSPVAERLLQKGLDDRHPGQFIVSSAGTSALVGQGMQPLSAQIAQSHGANSENFRSRQLTPAMVREANLILALTAEHRTRILQLAPVALKRTFTVRELGRMLEHLALENSVRIDNGDAAAAWRTIPAAAAAVRHVTLADHPSDDDVADPYRRDTSVYREMEQQLIPSIGAICTFGSAN